MPVFSLVTITKNNCTGLKHTAKSIVSQTFTAYEWIVIDGASTDGTGRLPEILNCRFVSEPDNGIYDAMNKGLDLATGDYVIFMNAGDRFADENSLAALTGHLSGNPDFLYGDAREDSHYKKARPHSGIASGMFTHHQAMIYRRAVIGQKRFNPAYKIAADYDFTIRHLAAAKQCIYIPLPVCVFASGGISQIHTAKGRAEENRIRRIHALASPLQCRMITLRQAAAATAKRLCPSLYRQARNFIASLHSFQ